MIFPVFKQREVTVPFFPTVGVPAGVLASSLPTVLLLIFTQKLAYL